MQKKLFMAIRKTHKICLPRSTLAKQEGAVACQLPKIKLTSTVSLIFQYPQKSAFAYFFGMQNLNSSAGTL